MKTKKKKPNLIKQPTTLAIPKPVSVNEQLPAVIVTAEDIRRYLCPQATDKEIFIALGIIKSYGLNPFKREVHIIKYSDEPAQVVVGYEVYIKRAERTSKLDGWKCELSADGKIATLTIWRKDWREPFTWQVDRAEFTKTKKDGTVVKTWREMGNFMLKKVCIGQGFRICFADELGGYPYTPEEAELIRSRTKDEPTDLSEPKPEPTKVVKKITGTELLNQDSEKEEVAEAEQALGLPSVNAKLEPEPEKPKTTPAKDREATVIKLSKIVQPENDTSRLEWIKWIKKECGLELTVRAMDESQYQILVDRMATVIHQTTGQRPQV